MSVKKLKKKAVKDTKTISKDAIKTEKTTVYRYVNKAVTRGFTF